MIVSLRFTDGSTQTAFGVKDLSIADGVLRLDHRRLPLERISSLATSEVAFDLLAIGDGSTEPQVFDYMEAPGCGDPECNSPMCGCIDWERGVISRAIARGVRPGSVADGSKSTLGPEAQRQVEWLFGVPAPREAPAIEWTDVRAGDVVSLLVMDKQEGLQREQRRVVSIEWPNIALAEGGRIYSIDATKKARLNEVLRLEHRETA